MKLLAAFHVMLDGWVEDLPTSWREVVGSTHLNWNSPAFRRELFPGEFILPGRKAKPLPSAPAGAHLLRAFEKTSPEAVRVVLLGQDPYPNPAWATGRAFEQGNLPEWPDAASKIAGSLRRLVQAMMAARTADASYMAGDRAWKKLITDARRGSIQLEPPREFFNRLAREGVLFLNTSLTISVVGRAGTPKQCRGHFPLWIPLIDRVLSFIATRQSGYAIFLLLGRHAGNAFDRSGAATLAKRVGTWKRRTDAVRHFHPAAITAEGAAFLRPPNPFCAVNDLLRRMGAPPILW